MRYLDVGWTCGGVAHSQKNCKWVSALPIANTDHGTTKHSTSGSLGNISWVQKAALKLYRRNVAPGVRRPGYKAMHFSLVPWCRHLFLRHFSSSVQTKIPQLLSCTQQTLVGPYYGWAWSYEISHERNSSLYQFSWSFGNQNNPPEVTVAVVVTSWTIVPYVVSRPSPISGAQDLYPLYWRCSIPGLSNQNELNWTNWIPCNFHHRNWRAERSCDVHIDQSPGSMVM